MGIRGLTEHIMSSSYLEDYELQNTDLVIDGSNLCYDLLRYSDWHPVFGGNYDEFEQTVSNFFDCLQECNVKPLVLLYGSLSESLVPSQLINLKQKIEKSVCMTPESSKEEQLPPLLLKCVFLQCLKVKGIPLAQCTFDIDVSIAAIAKALNCPVLGNASYYYLYEALYIPNGTVIKNIMDNSNNNRKTISCKIYRLECLLNGFEGLNHHTFSLLEVLSSNDSIKLEPMISSTVALIKKEHVANCKTASQPAMFIEKALNWLCKYTLEDAIAEIIKGAPPPMRPELLKIIEMNINKYTNPFSEAFTQLRVPEECFSSPTKELYRFKGNIETIPYRQLYNNQNFRAGKQKGPYIMQMSKKLLNHTEQHQKDSVIDKLPQWFKDEYSLANFRIDVLCLMRNQYYVYPTLFEDASRPPCYEIAAKIFLFVFQFLMSVIQMKVLTLNEVKRNGRGLLIYCRDIPRNLIQSLSVARGLPHSARKEVIDDALGIRHVRCIDALLPEWQLYIACLTYWKTHSLRICDKYHIYSILTCLIYKLTTSKIGYYNSLSTFEKANSSVIELLQKRRDKNNIEPKYSTSVTVATACTEIDTLDCLRVAQFFITLSQVNPSLSYGDKFKRHIVYGFSQFQCVLDISIELNVLLDWPYKEPNIADLYNGTLLYNLYVNFQSCEDMETYKNNIFQHSPSLLRAFNVLYKFLRENEVIN